MLGLLAIPQILAEIETGALGSAWEHLQEAMTQAEERHFPDILSVFYCALGDLYRRLGDAPAASRQYQRGIEIGMGKWDTLLCQSHLGVSLVEEGKFAAGLAEVEEAQNRALQIELGAVFIPAIAIRALLLAGMELIDAAQEALQEWRNHYLERGFFLPEMANAWVQAQAAIPRGDQVELLRQAEFLIDRAHRAGSVWWELRGFQLLRRLGPLDAASARRVSDLLDRIEQQSRHPDLRPRAESFCKTFRAMLLAR
jgi:hypothetical protein